MARRVLQSSLFQGATPRTGALRFCVSAVGAVCAGSVAFAAARSAGHCEAAPTQAETPAWIGTKGGAKYSDIRLGQGAPAARGMQVGVHWEAYSLQGQVLESTWSKRPLGRLSVRFRIEEGLEGMKSGGRREVIAPPHLLFEHNGGSPSPYATKVGLVASHGDLRIYMVDLYVVEEQS